MTPIELEQTLVSLGLLQDGECAAALSQCADGSTDALLDLLAQTPHPILPDEPLLTEFQIRIIRTGLEHDRLHLIDTELFRNEYLLRDQLQGGNTARVYKAWHRHTKQLVAIKEPFGAGDLTAINRLRREAEILRLLNDRRIVRFVAFEDCEQTNNKFLAMEFASGETLKSHLERKHQFSERLTVLIVTELLKALYHAHSNGVIHRDVKPANIVLEKTAAGYQVRLLDFGLGKVISTRHSIPELESSVNLTAANEAMGTFRYTAPEQCEDAAGVGAAADIYSVGIMTYEMLTGRAPFDGNNTASLILAHMREPVPAMTTFVSISNNLEQLVMTMLKKTPAERATIKELLVSLQHRKQELQYSPAEVIRPLPHFAEQEEQPASPALPPEQHETITSSVDQTDDRTVIVHNKPILRWRLRAASALEYMTRKKGPLGLLRRGIGYAVMLTIALFISAAVWNSITRLAETAGTDSPPPTPGSNQSSASGIAASAPAPGDYELQPQPSRSEQKSVADLRIAGIVSQLGGGLKDRMGRLLDSQLNLVDGEKNQLELAEIILSGRRLQARDLLELLQSLQRLPAFQSLSLDGLTIDKQHVSELARIDGLRTLGISRTAITTTQLSTFACCPILSDLRLDTEQLAADPASLRSLISLLRLEVRGQDLSSLTSLAELPRLRSVALPDLPELPRDLIQQLQTRNRDLTIYCRNPERGYEVAGIDRTREAVLSLSSRGWQITGHGRFVDWVSSIWTTPDLPPQGLPLDIDFIRCPENYSDLTQKDYEQLLALPSINLSLDLPGVQTGLNTLAQILQGHRADVVNLNDSGVTDELFLQLAELRERVRISIHRTHISRKAIARFHSTQPITALDTGFGLIPGQRLLPEESARFSIPPAIAGMEFIGVPAGSFRMGARTPVEAGSNVEVPQHSVSITRLRYVGKYEVTIGQILQWLNSPGVTIDPELLGITADGRGGAVRLVEGSWERNPDATSAAGDDYPMFRISKAAAMQFCEWCSTQDPLYTFRLPTEAEWEYFARADSTTAFHWGEEAQVDMANLNYPDSVTSPDENTRPGLTPVGKFRGNPWGIHDTHGNVAEWCIDTSREYSTQSVTDPVAATDSAFTVIRGGGYNDSPDKARTFSREIHASDHVGTQIGFRVVCE